MSQEQSRFSGYKESSVRAVLAVLFSALVWGVWLPVTRLGVTSQLQPIDISILRFFTAGTLLLLVLWRKRSLIPWGHWKLMLLMVMAAGTPYLTIFAYGMRLTTTGQGAVLGPGVTGTMSLLLGALWLKERLLRRQWIGTALTLAGVAVIVVHEAFASGLHLVGFALVLLASLCWGTFTVSSRALRIEPLLGTALIGVGNALLLIPIGLIMHRFEGLATVSPLTLWIQIGYQGVLTGVLALITYVYAVNRLGAARAASFTPLAPVISTILGIWWLNDPYDVAVIAGLGLVVMGVLTANSSFTNSSRTNAN
jgi:drug/metabolite transporter (DMT)-like permease